MNFLNDDRKLVGSFVALLWVIEAVNFLLAHALCRFGVEPRTLSGLPGIVLAPLLHNGPLHLLANTIPLIVLGLLVTTRGKGFFLPVTILVALVSGLGVWIFGAPARHVGASGLVFGYFGYLVARAFVDRSLSTILIAAAVMFLYGGILWGVLPIWRGISWESHLFGLLAGVLAATILKRTEDV